jgi:hypothetical protein
MHMVDASCPWIRLNGLTAAQGYRIDGATAGDGLGSSLASVGDQNGDGIPDIAIGASAASPAGRSGAGEVVIVPGQRGGVTVRDLRTAPPLQTVFGAQAGEGLGASLSAAADVDGDGHVDLIAGAPGESSFAGAAYLIHGAPGTTLDLAGVPSKIAPAGAGAQAGTAVAGGFALDGGDVDVLVSAPGANGGAGGAFVVGSSATAVPQAPAAAAPAAPAAPSTVSSAVKPAAVPALKKKLPLCPLKKPKPKYHVVNGKRVKVKPKPCKPLTAKQKALLRAKAKAKAKAAAKAKAKAKATSK